MANPSPAEQVTVIDSEGVRGTLPARKLETDTQVLVTFDQDQRIQVPVELLHRQEDGTYYLPLSWRSVSEASASLQADGRHVVAVVPVVAEAAQVSKRSVETGRVRIQKTVETREEQVDVPLVRDRVQVERVAVDRLLEQPVDVHYDEDTLVIPVMEEVAVVQKRLLLREEIRVTTSHEQTQHQETVQLQREQVSITRDETGSDGADRPRT